MLPTRRIGTLSITYIFARSIDEIDRAELKGRKIAIRRAVTANKFLVEPQSPSAIRPSRKTTPVLHTNQRAARPVPYPSIRRAKLSGFTINYSRFCAAEEPWASTSFRYSEIAENWRLLAMSTLTGRRKSPCGAEIIVKRMRIVFAQN